MNNKVLIVGNHPINADLTRQYSLRGDEVLSLKRNKDFGKTDFAAFKEMVLLADYDLTPMAADNEIMGSLQEIATSIPETTNGQRMLCHLLLRSHSILHIIRQNGFRQDIEEKLEVNPFTMEDQWSQIVAMGLDREPITKQSEKTVHLVIFGMSEVAEQVAINAAHVCHYPNYLQGGHTLRTRITVIDEWAFEKSREWIQRYKHLFDNCYYRFVDCSKSPAVTGISHPMYSDREDFVDVEWEFVSASAYDKLVSDKISHWSISPSQQLTIVFAKEDTDAGLSDALHLPDAIVSAQIPIYVYMQSDKALEQVKHTGNSPNIIPFGMVDHGYDVTLPLVRMAKNVKYVYEQCYKQNDAKWSGMMHWSVEIDREERERLWAEESSLKRMSCIYNAMTIPTKMRSLGLDENDWDKFYDIPQQDIEVMAQVEHNRWSVEELILGFRPCTDKEQEKIAADVKKLKAAYKACKIHYDLRAYNDLRPDGTGKPVQMYDLCLTSCLPLIAKAFAEEKGGKV